MLLHLDRSHASSIDCGEIHTTLMVKVRKNRHDARSLQPGPARAALLAQHCPERPTGNTVIITAARRATAADGRLPPHPSCDRSCPAAPGPPALRWPAASDHRTAARPAGALRTGAYQPFIKTPRSRALSAVGRGGSSCVYVLSTTAG